VTADTQVLLGAALVAAFVVGFLKTSLGGGIGLVLTPTLSLVLPPSTALALIAPLLLLSDPIALRYYWRVWDRRQLLLLLPGTLGGVVAGAFILSLLSDLALKRMIGIVALAFALAQLALSRRGRSLFPASPPAAVGLVAGVVTGLASTLAHSGGLVVGLYLVSLGLPSALVVGTGAAVYIASDVVKLASYWRIGFLGGDVVLAAVAATPLLVAGAWLGVRVNRRLPRRAFELALLGIAIAGSVRLLLA
jgi:uncharacterized membrane protein YfcA